MRYLVLVMMVLCSGCAQTEEFAKTVWGSTTRALEEARKDAIVKTYDEGYWDCIRAAFKAIDKNKWVVFKKDEVKGYAVVMGVKGAVNTTEIGIFFDELSDKKVRIEISSLSTNAKRMVAKALFHGMDIVFGYIPPDPEPVDKDGTDKDKDKDETGKIDPSYIRHKS